MLFFQNMFSCKCEHSYFMTNMFCHHTQIYHNLQRLPCENLPKAATQYYFQFQRGSIISHVLVCGTCWQRTTFQLQASFLVFGSRELFIPSLRSHGYKINAWKGNCGRMSRVRWNSCSFQNMLWLILLNLSPMCEERISWLIDLLIQMSLLLQFTCELFAETRQRFVIVTDCIGTIFLPEVWEIEVSLSTTRLINDCNYEWWPLSWSIPANKTWGNKH